MAPRDKRFTKRNAHRLSGVTLLLTLVACSGDSDDGNGGVGVDDGTPTVGTPAGAIFALTNRHDPAAQISASAEAQAAPGLVNEIVAYTRSADGALERIGVYETGGLGENIRNSGANPLASQDPLIVSKDNRFDSGTCSTWSTLVPSSTTTATRPKRCPRAGIASTRASSASPLVMMAA